MFGGGLISLVVSCHNIYQTTFTVKTGGRTLGCGDLEISFSFSKHMLDAWLELYAELWL